MDPQALYNTLQGTFNPDGAIRSEAERQLAAAESQPGYLGIIYQVSCSGDVNVDIRQAASIRLKNKLKENDWNLADSKVGDDERIMVKKSFIQSVIQAPAKVRRVLLECLRYVLIYDFPDRWPTLFDEILAHLGTNNPDSISGALGVLRTMLKRFEMTVEKEDREPLEIIVEKAFPLLANMFQYINSQPASPDMAFLQKLLCKIFWSSSNLRLPRLFFSNPTSIVPWLDAFLHIVKTPVDVQDPQSSMWKVKKWCGHIINKFLAKYGTSKGKKPEAQLGQAFVGNYGERFLEAWFDLLVQYKQKKYVSNQVLVMAITYVDAAMDLQPLYGKISPTLNSLVSEIIFPLVCYNDEDAELWEENPQEYMRKLLEPFGDLYSPRLMATNLLLKIVTPCKKWHQKDCLNQCLGFLNQVMTKYQSDAQKDVRAKDGAMYIFGSLKRRLKVKIDGQDCKSIIEPILQQHIIPEFQSPVGHLRAKAIWVCTQYAKQEWSNPQSLVAIVEGTMACMTDPELPVRVQAGTSLRNFIENKKSRSIVQPKLEQMVHLLFKLMDEIDSDCVIETLEAIIETFGENIASAALSLLKMIYDHFVRTSPNLNEESETGCTDEESDQAMAAAACLRAITTLISSVQSHEELYPQMEPIMVPLFHMIIKEEKSEYLDEALELLVRFTYFSKKISPEMWTVFPLVFNAYNTFAPDYLDQMLSPIDNFISRDSATYATGSAPSGQRYIHMTYQIIQKCLSDEDAEEEYATCPKIVEAILQNCKDHKNEIKEFIGEMYKLLLATMSKTSSQSFKILCMNVFASGLMWDAEYTIGFLNQHGFLGPVFKVWFEAIPNLTRSYDRKLAALGLSAVLQGLNTHGTAWLPSNVFGPEQLQQMAGLIMKLILECHEHYKACDAAAGDEEEEEDEDDSDFGDDDDEDGFDDSDDDDDDSKPKKPSNEFTFDMTGGREQFDKLIKEAREINFGDQLNFMNEEDLDDEEGHFSPIDDMEEACIFRDIMGEMGTKHPELCNRIMSALTGDAKQKLEDAIKYGEEQARKKAEEAAKKNA